MQLSYKYSFTLCYSKFLSWPRSVWAYTSECVAHDYVQIKALCSDRSAKLGVQHLKRSRDWLCSDSPNWACKVCTDQETCVETHHEQLKRNTGITMENMCKFWGNPLFESTKQQLNSDKLKHSYLVTDSSKLSRHWIHHTHKWISTFSCITV